MKAQVVIGANYGDEGKGLVTDYLAHREDSQVVIRFNGGAQAGHTVVAPFQKGESFEKLRHVFSHFSSGTFARSSTYLSKYFVSNPVLFRKESETLRAHKDLLGRVEIAADGEGMVTTPFDMLINQAAELSRGDSRHGSCGVGFGETIERDLEIPFRIRDLYDQKICKTVLEEIIHHWIPTRISELGIEKQWSELCNDFDFSLISKRYLDDLCYFSDKVAFKNPRYLREKKVLFEGAQGLLLDQNSPNFPHVTRSNTGLENALEMINDLTLIISVDVYYVTRSYVTRHGAGPLQNELSGPLAFAVDNTNLPHQFQGNLRYAPLDAKSLGERIKADTSRELPWGINLLPRLAITCLDQLKVDPHVIAKDAGVELGLVSRGPSRSDVTPYKSPPAKKIENRDRDSDIVHDTGKNSVMLMY